jgi:hypothetical protein
VNSTRTDDSRRSTLATVTLVAVTLVAVVLGGVLILRARPFASQRVDDAFVLLRYATNVRSWQGWGFNPGERVDAFTSPAMVALESAALGMGLPGLPFAHGVGLVSGLLVLVAAMRLCRILGGGPVAQLLSGAIVAWSMPIAVACESGLETAPFAAAIGWGLAASVGDSRQDRMLAGLLLGVAVAFRPDGVFAFACAFFASDVRWPSDERPRWRWVERALPFSAVVIPLMVWHRVYFGMLAANASLARSAPHASNRWASGIVSVAGVLATPSLAAGVFGLAALAGRSAAARLFFVFGLIWCAYVAAGGAERASGGRSIVPLIPFLAAGAGAGFDAITSWAADQRRSRHTWKPIGGVACIAAVIMGARFESVRADPLRAHAAALEQARARLGRWLRAAASPRDSIAVYRVGQVGYESGLVVVGTDGLTDPAIAHVLHARPGTYRAQIFFPETDALDKVARAVLARHPDMIAATPSALDGDPEEWRASAQDDALRRSEAFKSGYELYCSMRIPAHFEIYVRKGYVPRVPSIAFNGQALCD